MNRMNPNDDEILSAAMGDLDDGTDTPPIPAYPASLNHNGTTPSNDDILKIANGGFEDEVTPPEPEVIDRQDFCHHEFVFAEQYMDAHREVCKFCGQERVVNDFTFVDYDDSQMKKKPRGKKWLGALVAVFVVAILGIGVFTIAGNHGYEENIPAVQQSDNDITDAERIETLNNIYDEMGRVEEEFLVDNYVPFENVEQLIAKEYEYANSLIENGIAKSAQLDEENLTVITVLNQGDTIIYSPELEGILAGGDVNKIVTVEPYQSSELEGNADIAAKSIVDKYRNYSFNSNNNLDANLNIDDLTKLKDASVIIWFGHGGYNKAHHSVFGTSIKYEDFVKTQFYKDEHKPNQKETVISDSKGKTIITADFFDKYYKEGDLEGCIMFAMTCCSAKDEYLFNILNSKGLKTYYGTTSNTYTIYNHNALKTMVEELIKGKTANQALATAKEKYGNTDSPLYNWFGLKFNPSTIVCLGEQEYQLSKPESEALQNLLESETTREEKSAQKLFIDKLCANEWVMVMEGDFTYFEFNSDGTVTLTDFTPEERMVTVPYDIIDDKTVYFSFKNDTGSVVRVTLTNRSEKDAADIVIEEFGEEITGTIEWKSNFE